NSVQLGGSRNSEASKHPIHKPPDQGLKSDLLSGRAIRRSLKLPAQEPEPLAHGPPHEIELLHQIA
ncbi:MAG: hypothetical protein WBG00_17740, partial [Thermoanaerobaculia bacterium]